MSIEIVTRAGKGSPLNATEFDANIENLATAIENTSTGHNHDGTNSKKTTAANVINTPAGGIAATDVQAAINELDTEKASKANNLSDMASAATARTNLGVAIGTDVMAYEAWPIHEITEFPTDHTQAGLDLLDDANAAAQRTTLGLGTIATQAASSVSITGGSVAGITDLAVADGGTGASTASAARTNLGVAIGTDVMAYEAWPIHELCELCSVD